MTESKAHRKEKGPSAKIVFENSSFSDQNSRHAGHIENHTFNHSVSIVLPGVDKVPSVIQHVCVEEKSFIVYDLPVSEIIHSDLINAFMKRGKFYLLSHDTKIDTDDCIAVLPTGHLILNLCKDTYQQLGIEGKPSLFSRKCPTKFVVDIDLLHPKFKPGTKKYARVKWCFTDRLGLTFNLLVTWTPTCNDDELCPSSIQKYFHMKGFKCSQLQIHHKSRGHSDLLIPSIDPSVTDWDKSDASPLDVLEWIGGLSTDIDLSSDIDSYISTYQYTGQTMEIKQCVYQQYTGFLTPTTIQSVLDYLRETMTNSKVPWCSMTVHGFLDSPVSWGTREHGLFQSGDNIYTFILFPNGQYWLYSATAEHDVIL